MQVEAQVERVKLQEGPWTPDDTGQSTNALAPPMFCVPIHCVVSVLQDSKQPACMKKAPAVIVHTQSIAKHDISTACTLDQSIVYPHSYMQCITHTLHTSTIVATIHTTLYTNTHHTAYQYI